MEPVPNRASKHTPLHSEVNAYSALQGFMNTLEVAHTPVSELERRQKSPVGEFEQEGLRDQSISGDALASLKQYGK